MCYVTPLDFLEMLLVRLPIRSTKCPDLDVDMVRQHAQAFISLAAKGKKILQQIYSLYIHIYIYIYIYVYSIYVAFEIFFIIK